MNHRRHTRVRSSVGLTSANDESPTSSHVRHFHGLAINPRRHIRDLSLVRRTNDE